MLEVVRWDARTREAVVGSGFGPHAQWYRNVLASGAAEVQIARLTFRPAVRTLEAPEAADAIVNYERRNRLAAPILRATLTRLAGFRYDGSPEARIRLVETLPVIAFRPRD